MYPYADSLMQSPLFSNIAEPELGTLLDCLSATEHAYAKGAVILLAGTPARSVGVVLSGAVDIVQSDFWGTETLLTRLGNGDLFGEAFSSAEVLMPVSVLCHDACTILMLDYHRVLTTCTGACPFHTRLIANMLRVLAMKNIALTEKMEHLTRRTTREKLLSYLSMEASRTGASRFTIPFNRQELAAYLAVDRSALSTELGKMAREGILLFRRNEFELLRHDSMPSHR